MVHSCLNKQRQEITGKDTQNKIRYVDQAAFAAISFSSWFCLHFAWNFAPSWLYHRFTVPKLVECNVQLLNELSLIFVVHLMYICRAQLKRISEKLMEF